MSTARPFSVALLALLHILLGVLLLLGGLALMAVGFILPEMFPHVRYFAVRSTILGAGLLVLALIDFVLAYGLWSGSRWAWIVSLVLAALGILFSVLSLFLRPGIGELVSLIIDLVIIYYLMQPRVQTYFGRGSAAASPAQTGYATPPSTSAA